MKTYPWRGNIRELENLAQWLQVFFSSGEIGVEDLPPPLLERIRIASAGAAQSSFYDQVAAYEKSLLTAVFQELKGNVSKMAEKLQMDRSHLHGKLKSFGIREIK